MNYQKKTILLIAIATIIRLVTAGLLELGNDEVYYRMYAQYLQWNYFDHPPAVGWLIRATTLNLWINNEVLIRIGAIISAAAATWFMYLSGKKLSDAYTGFLAACMYTASLYGSIIAGTFILPDSPQMVCWAAGLYLVIGVSKYSHINNSKKRAMLLFGIVAGLGMLCKIHTAFLWLGLLIYILVYNRQWLKQPVLYLSGLITVLIFYPVIQWNINNHFVTYLYHSSRVTVTNSSINFSGFLTFAGGQFFYSNPVIFVVLVIACIAAFKNELPVLTSQKKMLLLCSLPLICIATCISFFRDVLPHWTGPAFTGLILLAACYFTGKKQNKHHNKTLLPASVKFALYFQAVIIVSGILIIHFFPGTLGKPDNLKKGEGDFTLDLYGWKAIKPVFEKTVRDDMQNGTMQKNAGIVCNNWFPGAHIDFYIAMPLHMNMVLLGDVNQIHQYAWINTERKKLSAGDDVYCIVPSNYYIDAREVYAGKFGTIEPAAIFKQNRNGKLCRNFYIWRLKNYLGR